MILSIEDRMEQVFDALHAAIEELHTAGDSAARREVDWKSAFSKARLDVKAEGVEQGKKYTEADVEAKATLRTRSELLEFKIAQNRLTTQREALAALRAELSGLQSMSASQRAVSL